MMYKLYLLRKPVVIDFKWTVIALDALTYICIPNIDIFSL